MARQKGSVPIIGRIGDLSFYFDKQHGYLIRTTGGPNKDQIKKKQSMEVIRQNNSEFGKASTYGSILRRAFRPLLLFCKEYTMSRRLQSLLISIIKADDSKLPGERDIVPEHMVALQGFELNSKCSYRKFFKSDVDVAVQKKTLLAHGTLHVSSAIGRKANCYKLVSVIASVDFKNCKFVNEIKETEFIPCKGSRNFEFEYPIYMRNYLFYGLVICFYRKNENKFELIIDEGVKAGFVSFVKVMD